MITSLSWADGAIRAVDQRKLPHEMCWLSMTDVDAVIDAISSLAVRGAPTLGIVGALATAQAAYRHQRAGVIDQAAVAADAARVSAARPTAVNLSAGVRRALERLDDGADAVLAEALGMLAADEDINRRAASRAADLLTAACADRPLRILTHCNTGSLATAGWGTALGAIAELAERGRVESVLVGETRPLLQGARLTTWELDQLGIEHRLCIDAAAASAMAMGLIDCVVVGADRVVANGDVANKIGTYSLAVAAHRHGIPFVVVAPESTLDQTLASGRDIAIETRDGDEVRSLSGVPISAASTPVWNPAFDVTPSELVTAVVTELRTLSKAIPGELESRLAAAVSRTLDFPEPGVTSYDLSPIYEQPRLFAAAVDRLANSWTNDVDAVLAIDARGFILGTALAGRLGVKLVLARKPGKLPGAVHTESYLREYGAAQLQVSTDALRTGARVLIADDFLATGGTVAAAARLIRQCGATACGVAVLLELPELGCREELGDCPVSALLTFAGVPV